MSGLSIPWIVWLSPFDLELLLAALYCQRTQSETLT